MVLQRIHTRKTFATDVSMLVGTHIGLYFLPAVVVFCSQLCNSPVVLFRRSQDSPLSVQGKVPTEDACTYGWRRTTLHSEALLLLPVCDTVQVDGQVPSILIDQTSRSIHGA